MAASLLLVLVVIQGPASTVQVDDHAVALALNSAPVLARGIQVQPAPASAQIGLASGGAPVVAPAPCVYYTYIAGTPYCSARAVRNGTVMGFAREDYLLWKLREEIAVEMEQKMIGVRASDAERRRLEALGLKKSPPPPSSAGTPPAGSGASQAQPRAAGSSSNFSGGMYTPPARSSTGSATTGGSAPAKRAQLQ